MNNCVNIIFTNVSALSEEVLKIADNKKLFWIVYSDSASDCDFSRYENIHLLKDISLSSIAPAVIECVEKFGVIDKIVFAPRCNASDVMFLEISEDEFNICQKLVASLFFIIKCSLPYMLTSTSPEVIVPVEVSPTSISGNLYKGFLSSMIDVIDEESKTYNITVNLYPFIGPMNISDYI